MKRIIFVFPVSAIMLIGTLTSCNKATLEERLKNLDGVTEVKKIENKVVPGYEIETCKEAYTFKINQPIDWNNKELGTFNQKVNIYYNSDTSITEYKLSGYAIFDDRPIAQYYNNELQERYKGNVVAIEYRFFADSKPEGFSHKDTKYCSYFNSYQASNDFHNIITQLNRILKGRTIFDGGSKGGYTTEMMCYYYPDDINSYVSYVAPLCDGEKDQRFHDYIYTKIGDKSYGKETAGKYREIVKEFQKNALSEELRYKIIDKLQLEPITGLYNYEIYENTVGEFATGLWQYKGPSDFEEIDKISKMPSTSEDEKEAKASAIADKLTDKASSYPSDYIYPYYLQAKMEMGNYDLSLNYLRTAGLNIKTTVERESYVNAHILYTDKQLNELKYTPIFRNALIDFYNTTKKDIVKIVGYNDPWYGVKAPVTSNEHIHLFEVKGNHSSKINMLDETQKNEAFSIIDKLLGRKSK